jgi:hypothetical protein
MARITTNAHVISMVVAGALLAAVLVPSLHASRKGNSNSESLAVAYRTFSFRETW